MKIISFSLYNNKDIYNYGAIKNLNLAKKIYPDWIVRFYIGRSVPKEIIKLLKDNNAQIYKKKEDENATSMLWRYEPFFEKNIDFLIFRDCDSRFSVREKISVDEWVASKKQFHIMRDHPYHKTPIMGGLWGVNKEGMRKFRRLFKFSYKKIYKKYCSLINNDQGIDQLILAEKLYPKIIKNSFINDSFYAFEKNSKEFTKKRLGFSFIGEIYDEKNKFNTFHRNILKKYESSFFKKMKKKIKSFFFKFN
jgi:protein O-GlcNAc transferase